MNPQTARWLLTGAHAFQKDPKLQAWEGVSRENFTFLLTSIFKTETFGEAVRLLEQVVAEELSAPDLPPDLKLLIEDWEKARQANQAIRQKVAQDIQAFIEEQKRLASQQPGRRPILPLAGPVKIGVAPTIKPKPTQETFTPEVIEKLAAEDEGVAFAPVLTILQPKVAVSFVKKVALAPIVKTLQVLDKASGDELKGEAVPEWREMLHQGVNSKDIEASVLAYQEAGVSSEHPVVKNLENKRTRIKAYEQNHRLLSGILKHYHEFSKITGHRQIFLPEIKTFLPRLAQAPAWVKKQGYSWKLRQSLNKLGFVFRTHERVALAPEKTVVKFTLPDKLTRFASFGRVKSFGAVKSFGYRKTIGAVLTRLGKTTLSQGIKKTGAWVLTRLGLATIPTGVTQVMAVGLLAKDVLTIAPKFLKWFFKKLWDNPLLAGALGAGLLLLPLLLTLPLWLVPAILATGTFLLGSALLLGATQLGGAIISGVGGFLGGVVQVAGGILSSLSTVSAPSFLMALGGPVVWATVGTGAFAVVVMTNTSAAFVEKGGRGEEVSYGQPVQPRPPDQGGHLGEEVVYVLTQCNISYVNQNTWGRTKECLEKSNLPNKEKIISQFWYSVSTFGNLQCVGFVRGVMDALGKDPGAWGNARDYLNANIPNYYPASRNMNEVAVGDLVIMEGYSYGHIAVVIKREERGGKVFIRVAEALGDSSLVRTAESEAYLFDGFIRPK